MLSNIYERGRDFRKFNYEWWKSMGEFENYQVDKAKMFIEEIVLL